MSVFKSFNSQDIIVSPFEVNKSFLFSSSTELSSSGVLRYTASNQPYDVNYNSIKQLYYSNYISGSGGEISDASTASINLDGTYDGPTYNTLYYNYLATNLNPQRFFPTGSDEFIGIISIPKNLYGDNIKPGSLILKNDDKVFIDDGEGILWLDLGDDGRGYLGNIIYEHGNLILIDNTNLEDIILSSTLSLEFSSSFTIYETQYKCTINETDFNYTLNPSIISSSDGQIYDHFTGSYFSPYITTIGLYNKDKELLAVSKLTQPLPISRTTDMNILIKIDKI